MSGNPKDSPWYSTPKAKRKRKGIEVTLSKEAHEKLERLVEARGGGNVRSQVVEELIMKAKE